MTPTRQNLFKAGPSSLKMQIVLERDDIALFHLLNAAREARAFVLITARNWPESWGVGVARSYVSFAPDDTG